MSEDFERGETQEDSMVKIVMNLIFHVLYREVQRRVPGIVDLKGSQSLAYTTEWNQPYVEKTNETSFWHT